MNFFLFWQNNEFKPDTLTSNLSRASREVGYWWSGPLEDTNRICYELYNGTLSAVAQLFVGGFSTYEVYNMVLEKNRALVLAGIYTFGERLKESEGSVDQKALLNEMIAKMLHDAKIFEQEVLCAVIGGVLSEPITTNVTTPSTELVAPIQAVINAIPGLSEFFNLQSMLEEIIGSVVDGAVGAIVDGGFADISNQIDAVGKDLGVAAAR